MKGFACQGLDGSCDDGSLVGEESGTFSGTTGAFPSPFRVFGPYDQAGSAGDIAPAAIGTSASP